MQTFIEQRENGERPGADGAGTSSLPLEEALRPIALRGVTLSPPLILAPMSGVTGSCFRRLIKTLNPGAVGLVVTEFISVEGMTRRNEQSLRMMRFKEMERPFSIQIFGYDIERMADAAKMVEQAGADIIDINSGCPVPKVVRKGGGCELMRQPQHLGEMLQRVRKAVSIPLTLKIRAGWDNKSRNALEIAKIAEDAGVEMLAVHGRSRQDMYRGLADWDLVGEVARNIRIPVVGSGDVVSSASAREAFSRGVQGIMIGRAAMENPWVFSQVFSGLQGEPETVPPPVATADVLAQFRDLLLEDLPPKAALGRLKQLSSQVTRRIRGSAEMRRRLCSSTDLDEFSAHLSTFRELIEGGLLPLSGESRVSGADSPEDEGSEASASSFDCGVSTPP